MCLFLYYIALIWIANVTLSLIILHGTVVDIPLNKLLIFFIEHVVQTYILSPFPCFQRAILINLKWNTYIHNLTSDAVTHSKPCHFSIQMRAGVFELLALCKHWIMNEFKWMNGLWLNPVKFITDKLWLYICKILVTENNEQGTKSY